MTSTQPAGEPRAEREKLSDEIVAALDPGIRDVVVKLDAAGFRTCDSGDGKSKSADWFERGEALPYPHVFIDVAPIDIASESVRMANLLGPSWRIEASYSPGESAIISVTPADVHVKAVESLLAQMDAPAPPAATFDLIAHLHRQREFSERTFGPGERTAGVTDHIEKEVREVRQKPHDLSEWIDLVLLSLDGAWRHGFTPEQIAAALDAKQTKNEARSWPDWRTAPTDKAIEHVRESAPADPPATAAEKRKASEDALLDQIIARSGPGCAHEWIDNTKDSVKCKHCGQVECDGR